MAIRTRIRIQQTETNILVHRQTGVDGETPADAPAAATEYANAAALKAAAQNWKENFVTEMGNLALLSILNSGQGDATALSGKTFSVILDEDVGQFSIRIVPG